MFFPYKDDNPRILIPYVTYIILGLNTLVFLYQFGLGISDGYAERKFIYTFGLIPAQFSILNIFTSMFAHGGLAHFAGNMWFLWIFGDNVEDKFGKFRIIYFIIFSSVISILGHVILNPSSTIPIVGISGVVAAVMGAYYYLFPNARILVLVPFGFIFPTTIKAKTFMIFWIFSQLLLTLQNTNISWEAHLVGFVIGYSLTRLFVKK